MSPAEDVTSVNIYNINKYSARDPAENSEMETGTHYNVDEITRTPVLDAEDAPVATLNTQVLEETVHERWNRNNRHEMGNLEQEIRFRCLQGWFFRCSWSRKFEFLREICGLTTGVFVLEKVLKCIDPICSKDMVDSFARDRIIFDYDVVPADDNRALSTKELNLVEQEDILWFLNLDSSDQIEVIITLLRLGGGGLIFSIYREIDRMYKERKEISAVLTAVDYSIREMENGAGIPKDAGNRKKLSLESQNSADEYTNLKLERILHRNAELAEFKRKYGIADVPNGKMWNGRQKEHLEVVDRIQLLPLWLNRRIMLYLGVGDLTELKKTGKYWTKMIEDALRERAARSVIDAKISKFSAERTHKMEDEDGGDISADSSETLVLGQDALLQEIHLKQRDVVIMRKENDALRNKKVKVEIWEEMCHAKICCCVNEVCKLLASSTPQKTVNFYSLRTGTRTKNSVTGLPAAITSMAIHDEGFHIVVGCEDGSMLNVNLRKNEKVISYKGHSGAVIRIHVANDKIVSASDDNTIKYFDLWSGLCLFCANIDGSITSALTLERDSKPRRVIVGMGDGKLLFIDLRKRKIYGGVRVHDKKVTDMAEENGILMTSSSDWTIRLWSLESLENAKKLIQVKPFIIVTMESAPTAIDRLGNRIFAACADGKLRLICKLSGTTARVIEVTQKKPIAGIYAIREKDTTKMIVWHESGIEMRTISFGGSSEPKKKWSKSRGDKKPEKEGNHLHNRRLFSVLPASLLHCAVREPHGVKRFKTNGSEDALDRSCTIRELRDANSGECEVCHHDAFTTMLRRYKMLSPGDFDLRTFPRLGDKLPRNSSTSDTEN